MRNLIYKIIAVVLLTVIALTIINLPIKQNNKPNTKFNVVNELPMSSVYANSSEQYKAKTNDVLLINTEEPENDVIDISNTIQEEIIIEPEAIVNSYSEDEIYELAKIIMCEAEGESQECKEYVGQVILNRVKSGDFPDTIHDVIFESKQFTPTFDGRWERVEPNQDCYDAAYKVINTLEPITSAVYFESCKGESWHSRNLTKVAEIDNTRFYIE